MTDHSLEATPPHEHLDNALTILGAIPDGAEVSGTQLEALHRLLGAAREQCVAQEKQVAQMREALQDTVHKACGRIGGHLGERCGCWKGSLDLQPSSESRRVAALRSAEGALQDGTR